MINQVTVPIFEFNKDGSIKPNPIFHRSWDKLHSRCIEYPYAASQLGDSERVLDVGTAKSDLAWINWLDSLPIDVYATDFDSMASPVKNIKFYQSDVRKLPFEDNFFDKIFAVSVIEHIGLEDAQTIQGTPSVSNTGDLDAIKELKRVLKPGGVLVMTLPFSFKNFIYFNSARIYSISELTGINKLFYDQEIEYYEYQYSEYENLYHEFDNKNNEEKPLKKAINLPTHYGTVTWRKIQIENVSAYHDRHCDGVICGIWQKSNSK